MKKRGIFIIEKRFGKISKPSNKRWLKKALLVLIFLFIITAISFGLLYFIEKNYKINMEIWISALPSYWGGIIGGIISGTISFLGVFLTIKYYRNSDLTKNRIEHMPFIHISLLDAKCVESEKYEDIKVIEVPGRYYEINKNKAVLVNLILENVGHGFANTLVLKLGNNFGGEAYQKLLRVGDREKLQLKFYPDDVQHALPISFSLQYIDSMTNEYFQEYSIDCKKIIGLEFIDNINESISIENGYPNFIGQVHNLTE